VSSISRHWVLVRADASRSARVVASIGPNTRVQLGETRGEWRRIRARGLSGWVEHAAFFAALGSSGRPHGIATR
jgi:SH3-like domain-containing protein